MYQVHDIEEIEGIGPRRAKALRSAGLVATEDLLELSETNLAGKLRKMPGFPFKRAREFRRQALLMQITGLTGQHAEAIFRADHRDLLMFAAANTTTIVAEMKKAVAEKIIPSAPERETVAQWQKRAVAIAYTRKVSGRVFAAGQPVAGATIFCQNETAVTNSAGRFWLPAVPYADCAMVIRADGYRRVKKLLSVNDSKKVLCYSFSLLPGTVEEKTFDEAAGQPITTFEAGDYVDFVDVKPDAIAVGLPFIFRERYKNGRVRLIGVYRKKIGHRIEATRIIAPGNILASDNVKINDVLRWNGQQMRKTKESLAELRRALLLKGLREAEL